MIIKTKQDAEFFDLLINFAEACTIIEFILEDEKIKDIDAEILTRAKDFIKEMDKQHDQMR